MIGIELKFLEIVHPNYKSFFVLFFPFLVQGGFWAICDWDSRCNSIQNENTKAIVKGSNEPNGWSGFYSFGREI